MPSNLSNSSARKYSTKTYLIEVKILRVNAKVLSTEGYSIPSDETYFPIYNFGVLHGLNFWCNSGMVKRISQKTC